MLHALWWICVTQLLDQMSMLTILELINFVILLMFAISCFFWKTYCEDNTIPGNILAVILRPADNFINILRRIFASQEHCLWACRAKLSKSEINIKKQPVFGKLKWWQLVQLQIHPRFSIGFYRGLHVNTWSSKLSWCYFILTLQ